MSSQPLPNPYTPNTYNPSAWASFTAGDGLTKEQADLLYLQFPFAQGLESMVGMTNVGSLTQNGASQFGTVSSSAGIPICVADYSGITPTDATTKIPTTSWVQTAIVANSGGGSSIFDTDNTWSNDNTFEAIIHGTAPASTASGTQIPTTLWVNDAITTAIQNITPSTNTTFSNSFDGTAISYSYTVPSDALYFNFSGCGVGGLAGANALYNVDTGGSTLTIPNNDTVSGGNPQDFQLWAGGQGGGALGNSITSVPNSSVGLAGQVITFSCSGNGGNTTTNWVEATWTNSITLLPITIRFPSGCNGGDATSVVPAGNGGGVGGTGGQVSDAILPAFVGGGSWGTYFTSYSAWAGSAGSSSETAFFIYLQPNAGDTPYQVLQPPYSPSSNPNGTAWFGGQPFPSVGTGSGTTGYGQILSSFYTPSDIIYYSDPDNYYGNDAGPIGEGFFTLQCFTAPPNQVGGTNASFIAYDDPDPATKDKQIYTDKEGLVVSQDLTGSYKTTTLTPTNLEQDLNGVVSTALIADIISGANAGTPNLDAVLTAGNNSTTAILIEDTTTPATLFTQQSHTSFTATDANASPQNSTTVSASSISVSTSNGDSVGLTAGSVVIDDTTSTTTYTIAGITAGGATSIDYQISTNMAISTDGYGRLDLTSGDLTTTPPRAVLQAFVDLNAGASYVPNINLIDLGGVNGEELLISNGNSDSGLAIAYNTIKLYSDPTISSSYIELQSIDAGTSAGSSLTLGQQSFNLSVAGQTAFTIATGFTDPVVFRRNISTTTNTGLGAPVGMLENSVANATTTGTTTLSTADAFATIINTPTAGTRIFVLPAPTAGTAGYWYAICNKSTAFTIAVQYPALTTIATIPVAPSATNGGSVARFAVVSGGASYFRVN